MNKIRLSKVFLVCALVALGLLTMSGVMASATSTGLPVPPAPPGTSTATDANELLVIVTNWILGIVGAVAVLFIIYGGFRYITAQGNSQQMDTAKNIIIKSIIGLVIIIVAYVIVNVVVGALGSK